MSGDSSLKKEFGDYQTPLDFAYEVCSILKNRGISPSLIFEPTCGIGNFLKAGLDTFDTVYKAFAVDINPEYCDYCKSNYENDNVEIFCDNYFSFDISRFIDNRREMLVIGNPPWATNSELNYNLPEKVNFKKLSGTDAITGASNFDICEYIILKLIEEFKGTNTTIAMLCKTSVARNVYVEVCKNQYSAEYIEMMNFNASKVFGISASACLLILKLTPNDNNCGNCVVSNIESKEISSHIKCESGVLTSINDNICDLSGVCQYEWRQGVKHDCSSVMELKMLSPNIFENKRKETVVLEDYYVFPLMKSSSFKKAIIDSGFKKYVIVTQKKAREETSSISRIAPDTWKYLMRNKELFDNRKSSIYNGAPSFSMFGVGDYSYSKYKVGISGFYKKPLFSLLYNKENPEKPIMLDDTSYFLSFDNYDVAYVCMLLLNSEKVREFLYSISFKDAKRPYTKKVLQRLDFEKCIQNITTSELQKTECQLLLTEYINDEIYEKAKAGLLLN